jgi:1,2-diacylglycerol 3-alpha-glucosyltransferase
MKDSTTKFYKPRRGILATIIYVLTLSIVFLFDKLVTRIRIVGKENLLLVKGGAFVISNHALYLDPALICVALYPRRIFFTTMEDTFKIPVIRSYIRFLGAFPVSGRMPGSTLLRNVRSLLEDGKLVHFFPEGNLIHLNRKVQDFKRGVFELAILFDKPIIPIVIKTIPRRALGERLNKIFCKVEITIGKPLAPHSYGSNISEKKELAREMTALAHDMIQRELA